MLILATESPTKRMIMDRSGLAYEAISANIDERAIEKSHPELDAREIAILLARSKAEALAKLYPDDCIVAADTFGILPDGSRLHKAKTATEKMKMCLSQSGKTTTIYTGVCVINQGKTFTDSTETRITYMNFNAAMLDNAHNYNPNRRNAALGFHVDSAGFALIEKIEGSYMGALGLPLDKMYNLLKKAGYKNNSNI